MPGSFDTARLRSGLASAAQRTGEPESVVEERARREIPAKRFGRPSELGQTCAFLCSVHAGYITGQNILMDGGDYPGLLTAGDERSRSVRAARGARRAFRAERRMRAYGGTALTRAIDLLVNQQRRHLQRRSSRISAGGRRP